MNEAVTEAPLVKMEFCDVLNVTMVVSDLSAPVGLEGITLLNSAAGVN